MITGLGLDIVELERIQRILGKYGASFIRKILRPEEASPLPDRLDNCSVSSRPVAYVAARFAAKEAAVKALGTGFSLGIGPQDIEVRALPSGKPELFLHGKAREVFNSMGGTHCHLSLSHSRTTAAAVVVIEGRSAREDI